MSKVGRETTKTETGGTMTTDRLEDGKRSIRLWSPTFDYLGHWCFACNQWHLT